MKYLTTTCILLLTISACNSGSAEPKISADGKEYFGAEISPEKVVKEGEFKAMFDEQASDSVFVAVEGDVVAVCKKKGCWMTMDIGNNEELFVKFKDYDFFMPLNCEGRTAVMEGWAYKEEMTVEELQHYAYDEGKTEEEIAAITEPEVSYTFMANGVIME